MKPHAFTPVEILEDRIAPAGLVTTIYNEATGELTVTGDLAANEVNIFSVGLGHRIEGIGTDIDTAGVTFRDIGKLTKLTIEGGADVDNFGLANLLTLTELNFAGGDGADTLYAENLVVKGAVNLNGDGGADTVTFSGLGAKIGGTVTATAGGGAMDGIEVEFDGSITTIGGSVVFTGGALASPLSFTSILGTKIGKGIDFVSGSGGGTISLSGLTPISIGKLATGESLLLAGGAGVDGISLRGGDVKLAGGIRMTGGVGDDSIELFNPAGNVKIGKLPTGQSISFDGGGDADAISIVASNQSLGGGIEFLGGDGDNELTFGANGGVAKIGKLKTGESVRFTGGAGLNTFFSLSSGLTLAGGIDLSATTGDTEVLIGNGSGRVAIGKLAGGQSIKAASPTGASDVQIFMAGISLGGGIEVTAGASSSIELGNPDSLVAVGKLKTGQSILLNAGQGDDEITLDGARVTLAGGIQFVDGGGTGNGVEIDGEGIVKIGKLVDGRAIKITGATDAGFEVDLGGNVTLGGSFELASGTSSSDVDFDGKVTVGKDATGSSVLVTGSGGADVLDFGGVVTLGGSLKFVGGADADQLDFDGLEVLNMKGNLEFEGGAGDDTFDLDSYVLLVGGNVKFTGGDDTDTVSLVADGIIGGEVTLDLGDAAAAPQLAALSGRTGLTGALVIKGKLTVDAIGNAGFGDDLTIANLSVLRAIDLKLGDGISTVTIDNLIAADVFGLDTRGGADVVNIELGNFYGPSLIGKLATIQLGLGDDELAIGSALPIFDPAFPDPTGVIFGGGLTADGGGGANDNRNDIDTENGVAGTYMGFELQTL